MAHVGTVSREIYEVDRATTILCGNSAELLRLYESLQQLAISVYIASELANALSYAREHPPCVIVAERTLLQTVDLINLHLHFLRNERIQIVVLTTDQDESELRRLLRLGYAGVLTAMAEASEIVKAVECVSQGEVWASRKLISGALQDAVAAPNRGTTLTARETEILLHIAAGHGNQWIAEQLFISRETVRWHLRSAYAKLGIHDRREAARFISASNR